jgi:hypothetical protein
MIADLDVLAFDELKAEHPDRYEKADLAATSVVEESDGRFIVQRAESDESHVARLVETVGHPVGKCSCDGYQWHDGPCSHLSAVWRMEHHGLVELPKARLRSVDVEVPGEDRELSDAVDRATRPEARADGGGRR